MSASAPTYIRPALLPGLIGAAACIAGLFVLQFDGYVIIRFVVSILALIIAVFAARGRQWAWLVAMLVLAVLWNPVVPFAFDGIGWMSGHVLAGAVLLAAGLFIRTPQQG